MDDSHWDGIGAAPMLIGLTGGMGCGKSTVLKMFQDLGCPVFSSDAEVARLLDTPRVGRELMARFGPDLFDERGGVDKRVLAWLVFARPAALRGLEEILHPHVRDALAYFGGMHAPRVAVAEVPLLFEKGLEGLFAKTVCVACDVETALNRYARAHETTVEEARLRAAVQLPVEEKKARADFVIDTTPHFDVVRRQVELLYGRLVLMAQR
jgi:dephospho-CoA kinase